MSVEFLRKLEFFVEIGAPFAHFVTVITENEGATYAR